MADKYVDLHASGNNNGTSWEHAFEAAEGANSFQTALDTTVGGETIHVADGITYTLTAPLDVDTQAGDPAAGTPIRVLGYNYNGGSHVVDGTQVVIDGDGAAANCLLIDAKNGYIWENFEFKGATAAQVAIDASTDYWDFKNCLTHGGTHGWGKAAGGIWRYSGWLGCESYSPRGFNESRYCQMTGCFAHDCVTGFYLYYGDVLLDSIVHGCSSYGLAVHSGSLAAHSVIDGCAKGVYSGSGPTRLFHNSITNNTTYGIEAASSLIIDVNNYFDSNGADRFGSVILSDYRGTSDTKLTGNQAYEDVSSDKFMRGLGAGGFRVPFRINADNIISASCGLPNVPAVGD